MQTKKITIEVIESQEFEVPIDATLDDIRQMWNNCDIVVDNANVTEINVLMAADEEWQRM